MGRRRSYQLSGEELLNRAKELGVPIDDAVKEGHARSLSGAVAVYDEEEIRRRIFTAEQSLRESRLWMIALASAIASVISAVAAWTAILFGK